jgi:TetR/AcrR family transcriptional regulator
MAELTPSRSQTDRADQTRARILGAATREFSSLGLAGARTERIAEAAGVNKALLYYYFRSKDALYAATLETMAARVAVSSMAVLGLECSAGERLLRFALNHFDRIYSQPVFQTLMQQEMVRLRKGESNAMSPLVEKLFRPMADRVFALAEEGMRSGELIPVEGSQLMYAVLGANVFYFLSAPMMRLIAEKNAFDQKALEFRRRAAVEFLGQAIFIDRQYGVRIAARVLSDTPMPQMDPEERCGWQTVEPAMNETKTGKIEKSNIEGAKTSAVEVRYK